MRPTGNTMFKISSVTLLAMTMGLTGCQTIRNLTGNETETVETAQKSDQAYYEEAIDELNDGNYSRATEALNSLRTFYPTGRYAEQALLDLMYTQYQAGEFEEAAASADQFIRLYPRNQQVSYAYYVRGVANMAGSSKGFKIFNLNRAERDTAYYRIAFANFQELVSRYPNSPYSPDAAQRMTYIYNQFAASEMTAANWYIEREAYVAAANRAKWVFQYYPQSDVVPQAIATLAYSYDKLGITDLEDEYKTLLQINYPEMLNRDGSVRINPKRTSSLLNRMTFGLLNRATGEDGAAYTSEYQGATKTQVVEQAAQLRLPETTAEANIPTQSDTRRRDFSFGLDLPDSDAENISGQSSSSDAAFGATTEQNTVPTRRTTIDTE